MQQPDITDVLSRGIVGHPELMLIAVVNEHGTVIPVGDNESAIQEPAGTRNEEGTHHA